MYKFEDINELPQSDNVHAWLLSQLKDKGETTLLAFADDGVIWGSWDGKTLVTAHEIDSSHPELRGKTLQQAYLFDAKDEVRLFRDELNQWKAVKISSDTNDPERVIVEKQILWGDKPDVKQPTQTGFLRVLAERKGIPSQVIPVKGPLGDKANIHLEVHHLVDYNKDGEAYIVASRLVGLSIDERNLEVAK